MANVADKELIKSKGVPAPQYYNENTGRYEVITGRDGANSFIQKGTVAMESWEGTESIDKVFPSERFGFAIVNDGEAELKFTINGQTRTVKKYEAYSSLFEPFTQVSIVATDAFRAEVKI